MKFSNKEVLFLIVLILLFLTLNMTNLHKNKVCSSMINTLIFSVLLIVLYSRLRNSNKDNFHFEVSGPKRCQGGPYMISSAPKELQDYCYNLWSTPEGRREYAMMNCTAPGFVGRPVHFDYTPESDDKWQNKRCNPPYLNLDSPCVL